MKHVIFWMFLSSFSLIACVKNKTPKIDHNNDFSELSLEIPSIVVDKSSLWYNKDKSLWLQNDQPFSGYAVSYYQDSILKEKTGVLNGVKQNQAKYWYPDGHLKQVANYHQGKLHGEKKLWSSDTSHVLTTHLKYNTGKAHGEQKQWYTTGERYKVLSMNMGKEEGIQRAYRKNGELYANYEAKEGRIFGLKKAALCYGLEEENIKYQN